MDAVQRAEELTWYHTLELAPGYVTPGMFDLRGVVHHYGLPERMDGMRALDVGTWDGFWAFEMERRGAEVMALDLDDERDLDWPADRRPETFPQTPRGAGFALAKEAFGSDVERVNRSIYHALPEDLGTFDLVFCGSVLIHLRDQALAIERIANLCRGTFISVESFDRLLELLPFPVARWRAARDAAVVFWEPNVRAWKAMLTTAGFDRIDERGRFKLQARAGWSVRHVALAAHKPGAVAPRASAP
ncbi:MAG: class I SAM-dependent methyltransferase [Actinomycetota bacterium]|nr:class I SAM-dependent methyltransferase [Actinomycetota bacterium]